MSVDSSGLISNEKGPKANPRELEEFEYQTKFTDPQYFCTHVAWSIFGDVPKGISIDSGSGKISGIIEAFFDQPSASDNHPYEELEYDGSNWDKDGRFKPLFFDFHFTIQRNTLISGPNPSTGAMDCVVQIPLTEINDVFIKEIKCQNINNELFVKRYLESTKTSKEGERTKIHVNGEVYTDYNSAKSAMPGPFTSLLK
jgi:hypothetical protein